MRTEDQLRTYSSGRLKFIIGILIFGACLIIIRLIYLQFFQHENFERLAKISQVKTVVLEADRGNIYGVRNGKVEELVINADRWTMFSDTQFIDDVDYLITELEDLNVNLSDELKDQLRSNSRYVVIKEDLTKSRKDLLEGRKLNGIYFEKKSFREYIEGSLASHVLGFLNQDGQGQYGVEQYYHEVLTGTPGEEKFIKDVAGVALLPNKANSITEPVDGKDIYLTIDISFQQILEEQLKKGIEAVESPGGTAILMDADTGAIVAMANQPGFHPGRFSQYETEVFSNKAVEDLTEPASTIKVLTMATALNEGVITPNSTYYNRLFELVDGRSIPNFGDYHEEGYLPVSRILQHSLNTGSVAMLKQLDKDGDNSEIELGDRQILYDYFTNRFRLNKSTNVDLPNEVNFDNINNIIPPDYLYSVNHAYSVMTFGQSMSVTPLQLATTYASLFNGGIYYQPYVVSKIDDKEIQPTILAENVLDEKALNGIREMMTQATNDGFILKDVQYKGLEINSKTGTAQIRDPETNNYSSELANGLMAGYIKSGTKTLVLVVIVEIPDVVYPGSQGAGPIWKEIVKHIVATGNIY